MLEPRDGSQHRHRDGGAKRRGLLPRRIGALFSLRRKRAPRCSNEDSKREILKAESYGLTDYRRTLRSHFVLQPFLDKEYKNSLSIGTLYVKVIEARGLLPSDLNGRSDPYVNLCVSGRYLSQGHQWPKSHRLHSRTRTIKATLSPKWDEEFTIPVRRSGAILQIEVMDWDRNSPDDPLGWLEIPIGGPLLAQKAMTQWYVLDPPFPERMGGDGINPNPNPSPNNSSSMEGAKEGGKSGSPKSREEGATARGGPAVGGR
ncbi:unnamed protein product, partial [Discosporangium mesarthrocarpum]